MDEGEERQVLGRAPQQPGSAQHAEPDQGIGPAEVHQLRPDLPQERRCARSGEPGRHHRADRPQEPADLGVPPDPEEPARSDGTQVDQVGHRRCDEGER